MSIQIRPKAFVIPSFCRALKPANADLFPISIKFIGSIYDKALLDLPNNANSLYRNMARIKYMIKTKVEITNLIENEFPNVIVPMRLNSAANWLITNLPGSFSGETYQRSVIRDDASTVVENDMVRVLFPKIKGKIKGY